MKLLVATEFNPNAPGGGPAVVRQMLRGFREQGHHLHWWACRRETKPAGTLTVDGLHGASIPARLTPARILPRFKALILERAWSPWAARNLQHVIAALSPDCTWVIPHDWSIPPIHSVLMGSGRKIRWHATIQDYPDVHGHASRWGTRRTMRMAAQQRSLYMGAATRDATSLPMLEDLLHATGAQGTQMIHQGLEPEDFAFLQDNPVPHSPGKIRIAYAGTVLVEHEMALFVEILRRIRAGGRDLSLEFWSAHTYKDRPWFHPDWMIEHGHKPHDALVADLRKCHWGFIPMALEDREPRYNRFSFPTKFITYLAAGLPVISMGHPQSSIMQMTQNHDVGVRLDHGDPSDMEARLQAAWEDAPARFRPALLQCAHDHFDAKKMRGILWECLQSRGAHDCRGHAHTQ